MSEHIEIDRLVFYGMVIEEQMAVLDMAKAQADMFPGLPGLADGIADVARNQIEMAQAALDLLIEEDHTWTPIAQVWCVMVPDGVDTDDTGWNRCTVHDLLAVDGASVCEGYVAPRYRGMA